MTYEPLPFHRVFAAVRKSLAAVLACVALLSTSSAAASTHGEVEAAFQRIGGHVGSVDSSGDTVMLHDLSVPYAGMRLQIDTLVLRASGATFAWMPPSQEQIHDVRAKGILLGGEFGRLRIDDLEARGTSVSLPELLHFIDPRDPDPARRAVAALVRIPRLTLEQGAGGATRTLAVQELTLRGVRRGKAVAAGFLALTVFANNNPFRPDAAIGPGSADNVDIAGLRDKAFARGLTPAIALCDRMQVRGLQFFSGTASIASIGEVAATGVRLRWYPQVPDTFVAAVEDGTQLDSGTALRFIAQLVTGSEADAARIETVFIPIRGHNIGIYERGLALGRVTVRQMRNGVIEDLRIEGILDQPLLADYRAASVHVRDADFRFVPMVAPPPGARPGVLLTFLPSWSGVRVEGLELETRTPSYKTGELEWSTSRNTIASVSLRKSDGDIFVDASHFVSELGSEEPLRAIGYERTDLSLHVDVARHGRDDALVLRDSSISIAGLGEAHVEMTVEGIPFSIHAPDPAEHLAAVAAIRVSRAKVRFEDAGLVERLMRFGTRTPGVTEQRFRQTLIEGLRASLGESAGARSITDATAAFLAAPGSLVIEAHSDKGVRVGDLVEAGTPDDVLRLVTVTATNTRPPQTRPAGR